MCSLDFKLEPCNEPLQRNIRNVTLPSDAVKLELDSGILNAQQLKTLHGWDCKNMTKYEKSTNPYNNLTVCRLCLVSGCKMYFISEGALHQMIRILLECDITEGPPVSVCWECCGRLRSAVYLKERAQRAHTILLGLLDNACLIDTKSLEFIDRHEHGLESGLSSVVVEILQVDLLDDDTKKIKQEETFQNLEDNIDILHNLVDALPEEFLRLVNFPDNREVCMEEDDRGSIEEFQDFQVPEPEENKRERKVKNKIKKKSKLPKLRVGIKNNVSTHKKFPFKTKEELDNLLTAGFFIRELTATEQMEEFEKRNEQEKYASREFKCTACYTGFSEESKYTNHLLKHKEVWGKHQCYICKLRSKTKAKLNKHTREVHMIEYSCKKCKMVTKNRSAAVRHLNGHTDAKIQCPLCPAEFSYRSTYMNHRRIKHASEYVCELCGYAFINELGIKMHKLKTHPLDKSVLTGPYCEACNVRFVSEEAYSKHLALSSKHSSDATRKEVRNDCSAKAPKLGVKQTPRKPLSKLPITCELCGAVVMGVIAYAHHFRMQHPGEKRIQYPEKSPATLMCDQCGRKFRSQNSLVDHMTSHSGERLFQCDTCLKRFLTKSYLSIHVKRHNDGAKKYPCEECGKSYLDQRSLDKHRMTHTELRMHECNYCGKGYKSTESLRLHVNHVHHKIPWPRRNKSRRP